ncbi:MAG TPA: pyridoxamine 5'-phosphate oxidase [Alphaproteobacteria bacterium]|jgi:pyridoxamine 5'-phosphate oxidase
MSAPTSELENSDPFALFDAWFAEAKASEANDPNAMAVATATAAGRPSVRMVLLKDVDARGFVFYTNFDSRKGHELTANGWAALLFHWKSLRRQVRIEGPITEVTPAEADAYFNSRARDSQVGAWASLQSQPMAERFELERRMANYTAQFQGKPVPRPPHWSGFRVTPESFEFWLDRPFRLHERITFARAGGLGDNGGWRAGRLYP